MTELQLLFDVRLLISTLPLATQVCSGSRGPGHPLTPPAPGGAGAAGVAGGRGGCGSKNWDAGRGLKDLFW